MARNALGLEFGSAARLSKRPGSVWNCLWGHALKRSPGINHKSRVLCPDPGFLSSATWPSLPKQHYNGLINQSINQSKNHYPGCNTIWSSGRMPCRHVPISNEHGPSRMLTRRSENASDFWLPACLYYEWSLIVIYIKKELHFTFKTNYHDHKT